MEEDTHLCLRCQQVVVGLENYVAHRGRNCLPSAPPVVQSCWANTEDPPGEGQGSLGASDFFLSLELKSAKPTSELVVGRTKDSESEASDDDLRPPTSHTGGKWKPGTRQSPECLSEDDNPRPCKSRQEFSEDELYPPRSHTSGKWQPGSRPELTNELWLMRDPSPVLEDSSLEVIVTPHTSQGDRLVHIQESLGTGISIQEKRLNEKFRKCSVCDVTFNREAQLGVHMFAGDHVAQFRNKDAWIRDTLLYQNHFIRLLPFQCWVCRFYCTDLVYFVKHLVNTVHIDKASSSSKPLMCLSCGRESTSDSDLVTHFSSESQNFKHFHLGHPVVLSKISARVRCRYCCGKCCLAPKAFFNRNHEVTFVKGQGCNEIKQLSKNVRKSLKKNFTAVRKLFQCKQCSFHTPTRTHLRRHSAAHQRLKQTRSFLCPTCGLAFLDNSSLKRHCLRHSGRKLSCSNCERRFSTRSELGDHWIRVHSEERSHLCQTCGYTSKSRQQLHRHERRVHGQGNRQPCPHPGCNFVAVLSADMTRHSRVHSGAKPYSCPHCKYRCANQENLRKHVLGTKKHKGKNLYPCTKCRFAVNDHAVFMEHLQNHHPELQESRTN